jgi:hypothetical protein
MARGYFLSGDSTKARFAYPDFYTQWKDADPEIPILRREAKPESAKLKSLAGVRSLSDLRCRKS